MSTIAIVVFAAPHYATASGEKQLWYGRIFRAIMLARDLDAHLVIAGDGNGGFDLKQLADLAMRCGISPHRVHRARNGHSREFENTHYDARAAARVLGGISELRNVHRLKLVTCWYHCPRSLVELRNALKESVPNRTFQIGLVPVWDKLRHGLYRLLRFWDGEPRGVIDAFLKRPHKGRGVFATLGKPSFEHHLDECPTPTPTAHRARW